MSRFVDPSTGEKVDPALRPRSLKEFVGQANIVQNMQVYIKAAQGRGEPLDHILLAGPPGLGRTWSRTRSRRSRTSSQFLDQVQDKVQDLVQTFFDENNF